jgi:hypothetical protein
MNREGNNVAKFKGNAMETASGNLKKEQKLLFKIPFTCNIIKKCLLNKTEVCHCLVKLLGRLIRLKDENVSHHSYRDR